LDHVQSCGIGVVLLFVVGHVLLHQFYGVASALRINFEVVKSMVVRESSGVYFEFGVSIPSSTLKKDCPFSEDWSSIEVTQEISWDSEFMSLGRQLWSFR